MSANIWCKSQLFRQTISARSTPWFNWRNHIQDSWAFMIFDPKWMPFWIEQTCRAAREDGFLPRCSARVPGLPFPDQRHPDIATWTAFCAARYFAETGDRSLFSKTIEVAGGTKKTTILDAIVSGLQWLLDHRGSHGMVLFLDGDWSDPLEEAGKLGIGESPWTTMALINALNNFVPVLRKIGSVDLADTFGAEITKLTGAVNSSAWDGNWYIRGIDDSGKPFSTASDPDGNVSLLMQAWAVLSGVSSPERTKLLVAAVDKNNKTSIGPILYGPPFLKQRPWIGRETAKMPGTCVNGSVYLHVSMMWSMVEFILGRPDQGLEVLHQSLALSEGGDLNKRKAIPLWMPNYWHGPHSQTPGQVGETMTSAGPPWFIVIMFEYVFGLKAEFDGLRIQPCFPSTWQTGSCQRPYRGSMLNFEFNRDSSIKGIVVTMDGKALEKQLIPSDLKMGSYNIKVIIGN
ncbi:MAG: hypothetical protein JNL74_14005 [Fibrobacteres bacterium]|nr:hypothetical protein [Fibrobacterota bacterium]